MVAALDVNGLRQALECELLAEFASPIVFKNVICGFQAEVLSRVHPASLFIWIRRDTEDVVRSILKCRMERYGSYEAWWSLKPSTFERLAKIDLPVMQVTGQVRDCMREFEQELGKPDVHTMTVEYADLLQKPGDVLAQVCMALGGLGFPISPLSVPTSAFQQPQKIRLPAPLEADLSSVFGVANP